MKTKCVPLAVFVSSCIVGYAQGTDSANAKPESSMPVLRFLTKEVHATDYGPCFSPDGKVVLFSRSTDTNQTRRLYVIPFSGGQARTFEVDPAPVSATRTNWSKQGMIAFTGVAEDGKTSVWLINSNGSQARMLPVTGLSDRTYYPTWYPDGKRIVIMDGMDGVLKRFDIERLAAVPITNRDQVFTGMPSVSPDGKSIAFAGQANVGQKYDQTKNSIWIRRESGEIATLEKRPDQGRTPSWSPDGEWLAFESNRGSASDKLYAVFVIRRDGTRLRRVTSFDINANHPVWSPTSRHLAFSARHTEGNPITGIAVIDISAAVSH